METFERKKVGGEKLCYCRGHKLKCRFNDYSCYLMVFMWRRPSVFSEQKVLGTTRSCINIDSERAFVPLHRSKVPSDICNVPFAGIKEQPYVHQDGSQLIDDSKQDVGNV